MADLDVSLLRDIASSFAGGLTPERYLQQLGLAEYASTGLRLRMAAILLRIFFVGIHAVKFVF